MEYTDIFIWLIENYLNGQKGPEGTVILTMGRIDPRIIRDSKNQLHVHSYMALKNLGAEIKTTRKELKYLLKCLRGEQEFSTAGLIDSVFKNQGRKFYVSNGIRQYKR